MKLLSIAPFLPMSSLLIAGRTISRRWGLFLGRASCLLRGARSCSLRWSLICLVWCTPGGSHLPSARFSVALIEAKILCTCQELWKHALQDLCILNWSASAPLSRASLDFVEPPLRCCIPPAVHAELAIHMRMLWEIRDFPGHCLKGNCSCAPLRFGLLHAASPELLNGQLYELVLMRLPLLSNLCATRCFPSLLGNDVCEAF